MVSDTSPRALAASMIGRPLAMAPDAAALAFEMLSTIDAAAVSARAPANGDKQGRPYDLADGVATIPVHGQTINRGNWLSDRLGLGSYGAFRSALAAAAAAPDVRGILLDFDSPGGELAGATEAAAAVRSTTFRKPVVAFVDSLACSAAYVIAAAANTVVVTPSATVGSIGTVYLHLDTSAAMASRGVKPTLLHAGAHKVDGTNLKPLPPDAQKRIEGRLREAHGLMLASVGAHRPALGFAGVSKTEAGVYMGVAAVCAGLADAVGTRETALAFLAAPAFTPVPPPASLPPHGAKPMSTVHAAAQPVDIDASWRDAADRRAKSRRGEALPREAPNVDASAAALSPRQAKRVATAKLANAEWASQLGGKTYDEIARETAAKLPRGAQARR